MPIEIRELVIRATVGEQPGQAPPRSQKGTDAKEEIVELAVERVLEVLRRKEDR